MKHTMQDPNTSQQQEQSSNEKKVKSQEWLELEYLEGDVVDTGLFYFITVSEEDTTR
ncbi:MAG: hypothetical protein ACOCX5_01890 [Chloroflexota bacterium]